MDNKTGSGSGQGLVIERLFDAPRERVWKAWTNAELLGRWWGPKFFTAPVIQIDLRVGGKYLFSMRSPEGQMFWSTGVFREIKAPERLVVTDSFGDEQGNVVPAAQYGLGADYPLEPEMTLTFEEQGGKTKLTMSEPEMPPGEGLEQARIGWNESLDKLAAVLK